MLSKGRLIRICTVVGWYYVIVKGGTWIVDNVIGPVVFPQIGTWLHLLYGVPQLVFALTVTPSLDNRLRSANLPRAWLLLLVLPWLLHPEHLIFAILMFRPRVPEWLAMNMAWPYMVSVIGLLVFAIMLLTYPPRDKGQTSGPDPI